MSHPTSKSELAERVGRVWVTAACMMAMFMAAIEGTIIATAMPTIVAELGSFELFSWVFASYFLTQAVTTPIYGRLADIYGRKRVFYGGTVLFLIGSLACGAAWNMPSLILFRFLQGIGAGSVQPIAITIIGDIYTPEERAQVQGWLSGVWGVAAVIGPILGAFIVGHLHWALVFWLNLPIGIAAVAMLALCFDETVHVREHRIDYAGSLLLTIGGGALLTGLMQANDLPAWMLGVLLGGGTLVTAAFVMHELRAPEPIISFALWRNPLIAAGNVGSLSIGALLMCVIAFLPTLVQGVMGRTVVVAGLMLTALSVAWSVASVVAGRTMVQASYRVSNAAGGLCLLAGSLMLIALGSAHGIGWIATGASLVGLGLGFCNTTYIVSIQTSVDWQVRGGATSSMLFLRTIGQAVGSALGGAVVNFNLARYAPEDTEAISRLLAGTRQGVDANAIAGFAQSIETALHEVFVFAGVFSVITLALTIWLPAGLNPTRRYEPKA